MTGKRSTPTAESLVSYDEAARMLGTTRRTIERMVTDGRLTKYTLRVRSGRGRMPVRVDRGQVEELKRTVIAVK